MSTRANIIIKDQSDKLYFYRHSDGYPKSTLPTLEKFLSWVKEGKIRNNVSQAAGWLIILGAMEYKTCKPEHFKIDQKLTYTHIDGSIGNNDYNIYMEYPENWKCGSYEPANGIQGDIEFLYVIDLVKCTITVKKPEYDNEYNISGFREINV